MKGAARPSGACLSLPRWSAISSSRAASITVLVNAFNKPSGPVNATPWSRACWTSRWIAASSAADGGDSGVPPTSAGSVGGGLTPTSVSVIVTLPALQGVGPLTPSLR